MQVQITSGRAHHESGRRPSGARAHRQLCSARVLRTFPQWGRPLYLRVAGCKGSSRGTNRRGTCGFNPLQRPPSRAPLKPPPAPTPLLPAPSDSLAECELLNQVQHKLVANGAVWRSAGAQPRRLHIHGRLHVGVGGCEAWIAIAKAQPDVACVWVVRVD